MTPQKTPQEGLYYYVYHEKNMAADRSYANYIGVRPIVTITKDVITY